jgi:hypothetical protein
MLTQMMGPPQSFPVQPQFPPVSYHQQQPIDNPPPIPDVPSQSTIQTTIRRTSLQVADTQPNGRAEISPVWTFALSDDRFYVVFFKNPVLNYTISVKSPRHLVLTAVYTVQDEHLTRLADICGLGPSHIKNQLTSREFYTDIEPPFEVENFKTTHKNQSMGVVIFKKLELISEQFL